MFRHERSAMFRHERSAMFRHERSAMFRLRAFVKRLRRKLGDEAARPAYVFTERGVGYRVAGQTSG